MSALAERLSRLRAQAGTAVVGGASAPMPLPANASGLKPLPQEPARLPAPSSGVPESIRRLLGIRTRATLPSPTRPADRTLPGDELAPGLHYRELRFDWGEVAHSFDASFAKDFARIARGEVLAFDTETTGLAGGTGTRAFMIGAADWVDVETSLVGATSVAMPSATQPTQGSIATDVAPTVRPAPHLRVRQLYLTQLRGEAAMLEAFAQWLRPDTVLVSYNGRCYDAPLLEARYRLARQRSPLSGLRHLDLLFPTRRRYKGRWENCRLATIERHVLGIVREDDLPGSEAPRAWLDWLRGGDATDFRRVLAHNDQDVRSLVRLLLRLGEADVA